MTTILIILIVYISSVLQMRNYIRKAHSKGGRWSNIDPDGRDLFFVFAPVLNTLTAITTLFSAASRSDVESRQRNVNKFFDIKKENGKG